LKCRKAYAIIPVGENDRSAHVAQQKAPEVATPGLFYSVLGGWLNPKAGYQLYHRGRNATRSHFPLFIIKAIRKRVSRAVIDRSVYP